MSGTGSLLAETVSTPIQGIRSSEGYREPDSTAVKTGNCTADSKSMDSTMSEKTAVTIVDQDSGWRSQKSTAMCLRGLRLAPPSPRRTDHQSVRTHASLCPFILRLRSKICISTCDLWRFNADDGSPRETDTIPDAHVERSIALTHAVYGLPAPGQAPRADGC
jgi:hypothetical protein